MKGNIILLISLCILFLIVLSSFSAIGIKKTIAKSSKVNNNGRIYGGVYYQGRCMEVPIQDVEIACGRNFRDYETATTNSVGMFEFMNLTYDSDGGSLYFIWVVLGQGALIPHIKMVILDENNPEHYVHYIINFWFNPKNGIFTKQYENIVFNILLNTRF